MICVVPLWIVLVVVFGQIQKVVFIRYGCCAWRVFVRRPGRIVRECVGRRGHGGRYALVAESDEWVGEVCGCREICGQFIARRTRIVTATGVVPWRMRSGLET
jgi:hypothetical protein